jgi:nitrate/nitrite transporter NarK
MWAANVHGHRRASFVVSGNEFITRTADFMTRASKWLVMAVLGLSGTVIYLLPFLREIYYEPLQRALQINNTQSGMLTSVFGMTSMFTYVIGGWVADRVSPRLLISLSLILTGLLGFALATFPSFPIALLIHALWGVTVTGMMWGALIKATREWAPPDQQGRAFGLLEAGRGVSEAAIVTIFVGVFARLGGDVPAFSKIISIYALMHVALGIVAWRVIAPSPPVRDAAQGAGLSDFVAAAKLPAVWLIAIVVMTSYCAYWGAYYFTPYVTEVFGMSVVVAGSIAAGKIWLKPGAAAIAGFVADRIGIWQSVAGCYVVLILSFALFGVLPGTASLTALMIANIIVASIAIFAHRGIYFALLEESRIPAVMTGTATGLISMIGFTPDIFMPLLGGILLDNYPGPTGYQLYFGFIAALSFVGLMASLAIGVMHRKKR